MQKKNQHSTALRVRISVVKRKAEGEGKRTGKTNTQDRGISEIMFISCSVVSFIPH